MIDDDDDIPNFVVSSGSEHHVSVSEHTGNAKTPHNKVVSHEEEVQARKLAFEQNHDASAAHTKPPQADGPAHAQVVADHTGAAVNVQKIDADASSANRQGVHTDTLDSNRASIPGAHQMGDNKQAAPSDTSADNNRQKIDAAANVTNVQALANDPLNTQRARIQTAGVNDNHQAIPGDEAAANRQKIGVPSNATNLQALPQDAASDNRQPLPGTAKAASASAKAHPSGVNEQDIPTLQEVANHQPVQDQDAPDHRQPINTSDSPLNRQAAGSPNPAPNHQAVPQAPQPGTNRQALGDKPIQDHRESASAEPVTRAKVDFPKSASSSAQDPATDLAGQTASGGKAKKIGSRATSSALIANPSAASPEALDAAAEFHRRVLDIKHNVDNLNHRLTDFEQNQP